MSTISSFSPIAHASAEILILGSMPGMASLKAQQYYAHPRNGFWRIMADIYGFDVTSEYSIRTNCLIQSKVAVWDVLKSCVRPGSLDSAIINDSRIYNDFQTFFQQHIHINLIAFNGLEAENSFQRYILPDLILPENLKNLNYVRLPSSSPANTQALQQKIQAWKKALLEE